MTAVVLFALAAAIVVGHPVERELRRLRPPVEHHGRSRPISVPVLISSVLGLGWAMGGAKLAGWVAAGCVVAATAFWLIRSARADTRRIRERNDTARAAATLALLLQAGLIPIQALEDAATDCPVLAPAALTGRLGGDVGEALLSSGSQPGREGLARVSAAWRVSERTGAPIALVLSRVAENLRQERHLAGVVAAELSAARASGRIMALLPFLAIAMGTFVGANPIAFLFGSWLGEVALIAGVVLAALGVMWTERISRSEAPVKWTPA